jgi:hypothetical protein
MSRMYGTSRTKLIAFTIPEWTTELECRHFTKRADGKRQDQAPSKFLRSSFGKTDCLSDVVLGFAILDSITKKKLPYVPKAP